MNLRFIDWIWHVRGRLALAPGQSSDEAFDRLDPLFQQPNTSHERTDDTLTFRKRAQHPQDKLAIFDHGVLQVESGAAQPLLRYDLTSRALLACFLAPLLFLGIAQATIAIGNAQKPPTAAEKAAEEKKKAEEEKAEKEKAERLMNPIDKFLGAPAPEKPKDKAKEKAKDKKNGKDAKGDEEEGKGKKPSPTPAYVFAALFAILYVVGRILEDWLVKMRLGKRLQGA